MTHAIKPKGLDHLVLRTDRLQKMVKFYENVVGCKLERTVIESGLYQLRAGGSLIDLVDITGKNVDIEGQFPNENTFNLDHFCIRIEPWDEVDILKHLKRHNVNPHPISQRYGADGTGPSVYIKDPNGNTVELKGPPNKEP